MEYLTHNETEVEISGTCLQGYVDTTYDKLKKLFGEPTDGDGGYKVKCEWEIVFDDGLVGTVYDWKNPTHSENITDWHIGGMDKTVVHRIKELIKDL